MTRRMRILVLAVLVASASASAHPVPAADPAENPSEKAAEASARAWLALVDDGKYGESWDGAAEVFRSAVTKAQWESALEAARKPLGQMVSRKLRSAKVMTDLPDAPPGEYVVVQYDTRFANQASALETIVPMKEKDGSWRVSGYFIK
jgi:Protein of unknown function (DUF4019)